MFSWLFMYSSSRLVLQLLPLPAMTVAATTISDSHGDGSRLALLFHQHFCRLEHIATSFSSTIWAFLTLPSSLPRLPYEFCPGFTVVPALLVHFQAITARLLSQITNQLFQTSHCTRAFLSFTSPLLTARDIACSQCCTAFALFRSLFLY